MKLTKKSISILVALTMVLSLLIPCGTVMAAGSVTVTYDTGVTYYQGGVVELTAAPADISNIVNVAFYDGAVLLGNKTSAPYTFYYINLPPGERSITAKVKDSDNTITTSAAVVISVSAIAPFSTSTNLAGTDLASYTGGGATLSGVTISPYKAAATATTSSPGRPDNKAAQFTVQPSSSGESYRISFANTLNALNTRNTKVEINMDMCFGDFNSERYFLKIWGANNDNGDNGTGGNVSLLPVTFKTGGKVSYYDGAGNPVTLKADGNTSTEDLVLAANTWYNFKMITWIDGTKRQWEFYIDGVKYIGAIPIKGSAPPTGNSNSMYYFRNGYVFAGANPGAALASTTYFDNLYTYQDNPIIASVNTPADNSYIIVGTSANLTTTVSASDASTIQKVEYYEDGQLIGESTASPNFTVNHLFPLGAHAITARTISSLGYSNYSVSSNFSMVYPITGVTLNNPPNLNQTYGATQAVAFNASTEPVTDVNPNSVEWWVNGSRKGTGLTYSFTPTNVGTYTVTNKVVGNTGATVESRIITVEKANPTVTWPTLEAVTFEPGLTLADIPLGTGFAWNEPNTPLNVPGGSYPATYTPTNTANYNTVTQDVAVVVNPGSTLYTVEINAGAGGTVTADPANATVYAGQTVEFTITPDPDYEIASVIFGETPVTVSNGIYTTPPLTDNATLSVSFIKKVKSPPTITITAPVHQGTKTFNGTSALSGKTVSNLVIDSSFIAYATISNPDHYTLESFGMRLKDVATGKVIELPMLYPLPGDQFAFQLYGAGFQLGQEYSLLGYVNYIDDENAAQLVLSDTEKPFEWE